MAMKKGRFIPRTLAVVALAGAALLAVVDCSSFVQEPKESLRIGINVWPPFELMFLAREKGFFKDEGVEVDLVDFSSYTGILRSYHQGNIDGFFGTLNEILLTENFQDLPAAVLVSDYSFGADAMVARDGITDLAHLRGRRIAFEESALGSYMLQRALETAGLSDADVTAVNRLPDEVEEDFRAGKVDAAVTYEPGVGKLLREPGARVLFSSRDIPGEIVDVLAMRRSVMEARGEEMRRVLKAWFRALAYMNEHPDDAAAIMARREGVPVHDFLQGLRGAHVPDLRENRQLMGSATAPGPLYQTADKLGRFLVQRRLAKRTASGADILHPEIVGSL